MCEPAQVLARALTLLCFAMLNISIRTVICDTYARATPKRRRVLPLVRFPVVWDSGPERIHR
eukprot:COSAG06_NODE_59673_length_273_cov_0.890805_1_plen_61_part_01